MKQSAKEETRNSHALILKVVQYHTTWKQQHTKETYLF